MVSGLSYIKKADSLIKKYKKQTIKIYPTPPALFSPIQNIKNGLLFFLSLNSSLKKMDFSYKVELSFLFIYGQLIKRTKRRVI